MNVLLMYPLGVRFKCLNCFQMLCCSLQSLTLDVPYFAFFKGWTPSAFISSRQKRADRTVLGPEDFMDEEVNLERNKSLLEVVAMIVSFSGHEKRI